MKCYIILLLTYIPSLLHAQELASLATDLEILTYGAQGLLDLYTVMNRTNLTPEQAHAREQTLRQLLSKNFEALTEEFRKARSNPEIQNTAVPINLNVYTKGIQDLRSSCEKYQSKKITLKELDALFRDNILLNSKTLNSDTFMYHMTYFADLADFATLVTIWKKLSDISQYDIQNFYFTEVLQKKVIENSLATFLTGAIPHELKNALFGKDFIKALTQYELHTIMLEPEFEIRPRTPGE